jgi:hypothetical protein
MGWGYGSNGRTFALSSNLSTKKKKKKKKKEMSHLDKIDETNLCNLNP